MILTGALCLMNISLIYTFNKSSADISSMHNIKYPHLIDLSTTTNILSYSCPVTRSLDFDNLTIKSHDITSYGPPGILTGYNFPYSLCLANLFLWQSRHLPVISLVIF